MIESRQAHNDQLDRQSIVWAQKTGWAATDLHYRFARPREEPLLWAADAMAGAIAAQVAQEADHYLQEFLPGQVMVRDVGAEKSEPWTRTGLGSRQFRR